MALVIEVYSRVDQVMALGEVMALEVEEVEAAHHSCHQKNAD